MDLVLFGIQGSGKGTLGKLVAEKYEFEVFETGSELRKLSGENSDLGKKVKNIIEAGRLVPNEVVMDIIENFMARLVKEKKALFDGVPRSMVQAETFGAMMKTHQRDFMGILIDVPKETVLKRLAGRRICQKCKAVYPLYYNGEECAACHAHLATRDDDNPESIKTRIEAYYEETMPVIKRYKKAGKLITMNGDQSIEAAGKEILTILAKIF